jgi:hypothetical protein
MQPIQNQQKKQTTAATTKQNQEKKSKVSRETYQIKLDTKEPTTNKRIRSKRNQKHISKSLKLRKQTK